MDIIPYFYYDIVARMIPGATTLYVLALSGVRIPPVISSLLTGTDAWKGIATALALGGAAYAVGVLSEALFFFPLLYRYKKYAQKKAIVRAINNYPWKDNCLRDTAKKDESFCRQAWEEIVVCGSTESSMRSLFAHCHRFQAESKLCQHLLVPVLLYVGTAVSWKSWPRIALGVSAFVFLIWASYYRDARRWWQVLSFGERLGLLPGMTPKTPES
jgi:hypothetical protein